MRPNDAPPGELCESCGQSIDALEDVTERNGHYFCTETCRRNAAIGEAEQLTIGGAQ